MGLVVLIIIGVCVGYYIKSKKNKNGNNYNNSNMESNHGNTYDNDNKENINNQNMNNQFMNNSNMMNNQNMNNSNKFNVRNSSYYIENNRIYTRIERTNDMSRQARIRNTRTNQLLTLKKEFLTR